MYPASLGIKEVYDVNDIYLINKNDKEGDYLEMLNKCVLIRDILEDSGETKMLTYKYKEYNEKKEITKQGKVKVKKTITIDIPAGIDNGEQLRVPGKGEVGTNGGANGDLYIEIRIDEHELYKRKGNDIYVELPVSITDLCLGCKKTIMTMDGEVELKIKEGSQPGDILRIKSKGINNPDAWRKGDFYCILKLIIL